MQVPKRGVGRATRQQSRDPVLLHLTADLFRPGHSRLGPLGLGEAAVRGPAPQRQRRSGSPYRRVGLAGGDQVADLVDRLHQQQ